MSRLKLGKPAKTLIAVIESEGGKILDKRKGGSHLLVDYQLGNHVFTTTLPYGSAMSQRWATQLRSTIKKQKENCS